MDDTLDVRRCEEDSCFSLSLTLKVPSPAQVASGEMVEMLPLYSGAVTQDL